MEEGAICILCRNAIADQTGSHIIPNFIIRSTLNLKGDKNRDKELFFGLSNATFNKAYFGRNILPEIIENINGGPFSDNYVQNNTNPLVKDNIFCTICEKRLAVTENYFAQNVYRNLINDSVVSNPSKEKCNIGYLDKAEPLMIRLFILSIVWRISVTRILSLKFKSEFEEAIRKLLCKSLGINLSETQSNCLYNEGELNKFPIILFFLKKENSELTRNAIYADPSQIPYFIIINEFVIVLYAKEKQLRSPSSDFFGVFDMIDKFEVVNIGPNRFKVVMLREEQTEIYQQNLLQYQVGIQTKMIRLRFSMIFERLFGERPDSDMIYAATHRIVHSNASQAHKFSLDHISQNFFDFMNENREGLLYKLQQNRVKGKLRNQ